MILKINARKLFDKTKILLIIKKQKEQKREKKSPEQSNYSRECPYLNKGLVTKSPHHILY